MGSFLIDCESVHVWVVATGGPEDACARLSTLLSPQEIARANRFRFDADRRAFVIAHGAQRVILGRYLRIAPQDIRFRYSDHGKPALADPLRLHFNTSNSGSLSAIAVTLDAEIGIDLEPMEAAENLDEIAGRFFSREEAEELKALPPGQQLTAFYSCWTRKEAFIKAIGTGLTTPLDSFRVAFRANEPARVVSCSREAGPPTDWNLEDLFIDPRYAAAVAYRGRCRRMCVQPRMNAASFIEDRRSGSTRPGGAAYGDGTAAAMGGFE